MGAAMRTLQDAPGVGAARQGTAPGLGLADPHPGAARLSLSRCAGEGAPRGGRPGPAWWAEVAALARQGLTHEQIAERIGRCGKDVCVALKRLREGARAAEPEERAGDIILGKGAGALVRSHAPRTPAAAVPRETVAEAARAFARGEISRDEMMRRITPQRVS